MQVVGLGPGATIRNNTPDFNLEVAMSDITPADIEMLTRTLNLRETTPTTLHALTTSFGHDWFRAFKSMNRDEIEVEDEKTGRIKKVPHPDSVAAWALSNGVNRRRRKVCTTKCVACSTSPISSTNQQRTRSRRSSTISTTDGISCCRSANSTSDLDYLLVSNLLTRKISETWEKRVNDYRTHGGPEPRHLILVVEEAHKLLNREMAAQTTFATIAREMRKYYVTLLIVDQRPSQIYDEVMSQLGTRISGWLGDEDDIHAVLSGLAGREALRGMMARLQPKEEVLLLGWGSPCRCRSSHADMMIISGRNCSAAGRNALKSRI